MSYAGLDIHSKWITFCILDENGKVVRRGQVRTIAEMLRVLEGLPDRFEVCYEASCGYGHFHDLLAPLASRVVVAHPGLCVPASPRLGQTRRSRTRFSDPA